jgi:hypothetical protein
MNPGSTRRRLLLPLAGLAALVLIAAPVLGADPSPKPEQAKVSAAISKTLTGMVTTTTDAKGRATFLMTVAGVTWELSAGPKWFWSDKNPLAAFVGKSVEITGSYHAGETDLDVATIDGKPLRAPGKPPWAGGPKVVGKIHPGWKDLTAGGKPGHGRGRAGAPGQSRDKTEHPSESEAPGD